MWEQGVPAWTALVRAFGISPEAAKQAQCLSRWLSGEALFHIIMTQACTALTSWASWAAGRHQYSLSLVRSTLKHPYPTGHSALIDGKEM